jgi:ADP-heptose:LPS heptosyltransferase
MKRLVLSRPDRLGDVLITSSLLPALRAALPDTEIYWLAEEPFRCLFDAHSLLTGFLTKNSAAEAFQTLQPDAVVHFHPDKVVEEAAMVAKVPMRLGYRSSWFGSSLTQTVPDHRARGLKHEAVYAAALLQRLGLEIQPSKPCIHLSKESLARLQSKVSWSLASTNYVVINPTAHSPTLRWPWQRFLEVAQWLVREHHLVPVLTGFSTDDVDGQALQAALQETGIAHENLLGQLALDELAHLLHRARLLISRNTGTSHLAAAVDCPQVEIFGRFTGRYSVTRWQAQSPLSQRLVPDLVQSWWEPNPLYWSRCARGITVDQVCQAAALHLT